MSNTILTRIARELGLGAPQVERTAALLDEGNTVPFITRYRKEATGGLDEEQIRRLAERLEYLRGLEARRAEVRAHLEQGGHLTPELEQALAAAETLQLTRGPLPALPAEAAHPRPGRPRDGPASPWPILLLARQCGDRAPAEVCAPFLVEQGSPTRRRPWPAPATSWPRRWPRRPACARPCARPCGAPPACGWPAGRARPTRRAPTRTTTSSPSRSRPCRPTACWRSTAASARACSRSTSTRHQEAFIGSLQRRYAPGQSWADGELRAAVADGYKRLLAPAIERELRAELTAEAEAARIWRSSPPTCAACCSSRPCAAASCSASTRATAPAASWRWSTRPASYVEGARSTRTQADAGEARRLLELLPAPGRPGDRHRQRHGLPRDRGAGARR